MTDYAEYSVRQLVEAIVMQSSNYARGVFVERFHKSGKKDFWQFVDGESQEKPRPAVVNTGPLFNNNKNESRNSYITPEEREMVRNIAKYPERFEEVVRILRNKWIHDPEFTDNRIDPKTGYPRMRKEPWECKDFLDEILNSRRIEYSDLSGTRKGFFDLILDSWLAVHPMEECRRGR